MTESTGPTADGTTPGLRLELADLHGTGPRALSGNLADALRRAVRGGRLPAGTRLPASRSLALDLSVSRGVVVRAYEQLVAEGYLHARTGHGTVVGEIHAPLDAAVGASGEARRPLPAFDPGNPGVPALGSFPRTAWLRALDTAIRSLPDADLGYGDPRGHPRLRHALAAYLGRTRAVVAPPDRILVTGGYAQAARLVAEALVQRGVTRIGIEDPGSIGVARTLRHGGLDTHPIPVDEYGIDVAALAAGDVGAVAVTPAHQFPTGAVLAPARRTALLDWADDRGAVVVEDDYDAEYRYDRSPVGALQGLAPDRVVYGGSISKTLAPALRLGWLVAPPGLAATLTEAKYWSDIGEPVLEQVALAVFLESGALDRHVRRMATRYASRRRALRGAVARRLPGWTVTGIAAGLHAVLVPEHPVPADVLDAMVGAPDGLRAVPLAAYAQAAQTRHTAQSRHTTQPRPGLVVGYGAVSVDRIERGIAAMAAVAV